MAWDPVAIGRILRLALPWSRSWQLTVLQDGEPVLDLAEGCAPDDLFWTFSASKPFVALLVHQAAEQGLLDLDAPVAHYWPEFAGGGKGRITIRQVLRHRTGLPTAGSALGDALAMPNWARTIRRIEHARLAAEPPEAPAYQFVIFGFVLGEVLQRVTGEPIVDRMRREILDPLQLRDTHLGLPPALWDRHRDIQTEGIGATAASRFLNRRATWEAVIPSAGVVTTSRDLAAFYDELLRIRRDEATTRLVTRRTLRRALRPTSEGEWDLFARSRIRWSEGFQLGGPRGDGTEPAPLAPAGRKAFGHNGSNCCIGWADPKRGLAVAYLTDRLPRSLAGNRHLGELTAAVIAAAGTV